MALTFDGQQPPLETALVGVGLIIVPPRDTATNIPWTGGIEVERAPDASGAPGTWGLIATLDHVPPAGGRFIDDRPWTTLVWWYRVRPARAGAVGAYSAAVSATPGLFPRGTRAGFQTGDAATFYAGVRGDPMSDEKFALTASDTAGKDVDDDVFVKATKTVKVGTVASPSSITKALRFPAAVLVPATEERAWEFFSLIYVNPGATGAGNQLTLIGSLPVPKGVTLTAFRVRHYRNAVGDFARSALYRISGEVAASLAIVTHDTTGYQTQSAGISQLVGDEQYMIFVELTSDVGSGVTGARFVWIELDYTMPDYSKGY